MATIFVADDHPVIIKGLKLLLEMEHEFRIVGWATDGPGAIKGVEHHTPNLLILDLMLPTMNGLEVLKKVKKISPQTHVLMLSMHSDKSFVIEAFKNGALGYMLKDSANNELVDAVRTVASGRRFLNSSISQQDLDDFSQMTQDTQMDQNEKKADLK